MAIVSCTSNFTQNNKLHTLKHTTNNFKFKLFGCRIMFGYGSKIVADGGRQWQESRRGGTSRNTMFFLLLLFILLSSGILIAGWSKYQLRLFQQAISPLIEQLTLPTSFIASNQQRLQHSIQCTTNTPNQSCIHNFPNTNNYSSTKPVRPPTCPDYFRWIYDDLRPWKETGITWEMLEGARKTAHFRLVIQGGRVYVEKYRSSIQTRDKFTLWGILQLLRRYPGRLPDLELLFDCDDKPVIPQKHYKSSDSKPPSLFKYSSDQNSLDIVFPDWSFWGWPEYNIKPWRSTSTDIQEGNKRSEWTNRKNSTYWRANPNNAPRRADFLMKCNTTNTTYHWNAHLYTQDWKKLAEKGYQESNFEDQFSHMYMIYIEGRTWSVSEKYILGSDSMTLVVKPKYHNFFSRELMPLVHYWPIRINDNCKSLKFALEWGKNHTDEVQQIGQTASRYIHDDVKMEYVYDYMFHLLNKYAKLLKFKSVIPPKAVELCSEAMACEAEGKWRKFMEETLEKSPSNELPCTLPPYDPIAIRTFYEKKTNWLKEVGSWEDRYWRKHEP